MIDELQTNINRLKAPALAVIASEVDFAIRLQEALLGPQNAPQGAEEGEARESGDAE